MPNDTGKQHGTAAFKREFPDRVPFFMNWEATFPPKYGELERLWNEGREDGDLRHKT